MCLYPVDFFFMKIVIMAGGSGTRLWPVSRQHSPKQGQPFGDSQSMLQKTFQRLRRGWSTKDIYISTSLEQYPALHQQLPSLPRSKYILETARRETAAAIGLVAVTLHHLQPKGIMATANSDAYIKQTDDYVAALKTAEQVVNKYPQQTALLGIKPRFADTGLGYIKMKRQVDTVRGRDVFLVDRFVEKPDQRTADRYVQSWQYLWNPAMFVFRVDAMLEKFRRHLNPSYKILMKIQASLGTRHERSTIKRLFPKMQKISIDYGIMEKDRSMLVIPADFTWSDIGSWGAVYDMLSNHPGENLLHGRHITHDASGNLIFSYSGKLIATAGVHDMIIIETKDAILVCPRHRAQDVKHLVTQLEQQGLTQYL